PPTPTSSPSCSLRRPSATATAWSSPRPPTTNAAAAGGCFPRSRATASFAPAARRWWREEPQLGAGRRIFHLHRRPAFEMAGHRPVATAGGAANQCPADLQPDLDREPRHFAGSADRRWRDRPLAFGRYDRRNRRRNRLVDHP